LERREKELSKDVKVEGASRFPISTQFLNRSSFDQHFPTLGKIARISIETFRGDEEERRRGNARQVEIGKWKSESSKLRRR